MWSPACRTVVPELLALLVALPACLIQRSDADCSSATSCDGCIQVSGCGWCPGSGCVRGTSLGPDDDRECRSAFEFVECSTDDAGPDVGPQRCSADSCAGCLEDAGCRWCSLAPDLYGQRRSYCAEAMCGSGTSYDSTCPAAEPLGCGSFETCEECTRDPQCIYCWDYWISETVSTEECSNFRPCYGIDGWCVTR